MWAEDGALDLRDRATAKAREILAGHEPEPLPPEVLAELSAIVARAEARAAG